MSTPISLQEQAKTLKDLINHLSSNLEQLNENHAPAEPDKDPPASPQVATALYEGESNEGTLEFEELESSVFEAMDAFHPIMDNILHGEPGCFSAIDAETATLAELTPSQTASLNQTLQYMNTLYLVSVDSAIPITVTRADTVGMMSASIAVNMPIASIGLILRLLALLKKLYDMLKKLWKILFGIKQHINKIKQVKKLKNAGKITAGQAAKAIAKHVALLAEKIATATALAKALKDKIKALREAGNNEEADALEKRLNALEKQIKAAEKELEDLQEK